MLGQPLWYIGVFILVVLLLGSFPIASRYERKQDERDRALWEDTFGTRRPW